MPDQPRLLFITSNRLGDAVLSTAALEHACALVPGAQVTVVCGWLPSHLFRAVPGLEKLLRLTKRRGGAHWFELWGELIGKRFDLAVDLRGSLITYALRAKKRVVYRKNPQLMHKLDELAALFGAQSFAPKLHVDSRARFDARALVDIDKPILALGPGANFVGKVWPHDRFADLTLRLIKGPLTGARVVLLGAGDADEAIAIQLASTLRGQGVEVIDCINNLDVLAAAALLKRSTLFVGNDSGLMHIAAAVGCPTIGMFGPSDERIYGPRGPKARSVRGSRSYDEIAAAAGDFKKITQSLMTDLSVDAVETAAREVLGGKA